MTPQQLEIQVIATVTAVACALPGVYLVLRRMALLSDAISHSILLGIVLAFFLTEDLGSPLLIVSAAATGLLTVWGVESLQATRLVKEDTAIGLVFPFLFSLGVILIARHAGQVHLDTDIVLLGELAFAPFDRWEILSISVPKSLVVMSIILILNVLFIAFFHKELKLVTFDTSLAAALGFSPVLVHYSLMSAVSVTVVGAFEAVGSILVVALMIAPPATAYLLTERLERMLILSGIFGVVSAIGGYWLAHVLSASIAGAMATTAGLLFGLAFVLAPEHGLLAQALRRSRQRREFTVTLLTIHLLTHEGRPEEEQESRLETLHEHMRWTPDFTGRVIRLARRKALIEVAERRIFLTEEGRLRARIAIER